MSKDYTPICPSFDSYHMFYENQKIVCCRLYMNIFGELSIECGGLLDYVRADAYPKICAVSDSIWDSVIQYNQGKICCALFEKKAIKIAQEKLPAEETIRWLATPNSTDEPPIFAKKQSDWKMVYSKASQHSYFDGDPRGEQGDCALVDSANNLCYHNCGEVLKRHDQINNLLQSRLACPHCKTINLIPHKVKRQ